MQKKGQYRQYLLLALRYNRYNKISLPNVKERNTVVGKRVARTEKETNQTHL